MALVRKNLFVTHEIKWKIVTKREFCQVLNSLANLIFYHILYNIVEPGDNKYFWFHVENYLLAQCYDNKIAIMSR